MNDARQIAFTGKLEMSAKDGTLHIARREHTKVVQAKLTNCDNFWLASHLAILLSHLVAVRVRVVGMRTNAGKYHARVRLRQRERGLAGRQINARVYHARHAAVYRGLNYGLAVGGETRHIYMRMTINKQARCPFKQAKKGKRQALPFLPSLH